MVADDDLELGQLRLLEVACGYVAYCDAAFCVPQAVCGVAMGWCRYCVVLQRDYLPSGQHMPARDCRSLHYVAIFIPCHLYPTPFQVPASSSSCSISGSNAFRWRDSILQQPYEDVRTHYSVSASKLGSGRYGVIRRCRHRETGREMACKTIRKEQIKVTCSGNLLGVCGCVKGDVRCVEGHIGACGGGQSNIGAFRSVEVVGRVREGLEDGVRRGG